MREHERAIKTPTQGFLIFSLSLFVSLSRSRCNKRIFFLSNKFVQKEILKNFNREVKSFYCAFLSLSDVTSFILMMMMMMIRTCAILHIRIDNHLVMDSCCRGGIVHTRCGCSCALLVRPYSPTALWRFRASTSNSPIDLFQPHTHTHIRCNHHTYAQQGIRVYEDDHFQPPMRQLANPKALWLLRVSI